MDARLGETHAHVFVFIELDHDVLTRPRVGQLLERVCRQRSTSNGPAQWLADSLIGFFNLLWGDLLFRESGALGPALGVLARIDELQPPERRVFRSRLFPIKSAQARNAL